jgi:hypothetical protein
VWDQFQRQAAKDFNNANIRYEKQLAVHLQDLAKWEQEHQQQQASTSTTIAKGKGKRKAGDPKPRPAPPVKPLPRMHEDEPVNFLRLATALKLLLGQSIDEAMILRGAQLFEDYIIHFKEVRNHH